jgi:hypothetical protein
VGPLSTSEFAFVVGHFAEHFHVDGQVFQTPCAAALSA